MEETRRTQSDIALALLERQGIARLSELVNAGASATAISRLKEKGIVVQLGRGLYQLADTPFDANHALAEAGKIAPNGIICLASALAFHELTDTVPSRVWMAIGAKDRQPKAGHLPVKFVHFGAKVFRSGIERHRIEGVSVGIYSPAKTVVDLFRYRQSEGRRYRNSPGLNLALEGMKEALRQRKATPSAIATHAVEAGIWKIVQPYLEAMTANG